MMSTKRIGREDGDDDLPDSCELEISEQDNAPAESNNVHEHGKEELLQVVQHGLFRGQLIFHLNRILVILL